MKMIPFMRFGRVHYVTADRLYFINVFRRSNGTYGYGYPRRKARDDKDYLQRMYGQYGVTFLYRLKVRFK